MSRRAASVSIIAPHGYGHERLARLTEQIVRDLRLPADIHAYEGRRTVAAEIDFSRSFRRSGFRLTYNVPMGRIAESLRSTDLPRPIVVGLWRVEQAGRTRSDSEAWFGSLAEAATRGTLHYEAVATWKAVPAALMLYGGGLMCILLPWLVALRKPKANASIADPDEIQRRYDRQPSAWIAIALAMAMMGGMLVIMMVATGGIAEGMQSLEIILPIPFTTLIRGLAFAWPASWAACWLTMRRRRPAPPAGEQPLEEEWMEENPSLVLARSLTLLLLPALLMLALLLGLLPVLLRVVTNHPEWKGAIRTGVHGLRYALFASFGLGAWLSARGGVVTLTSGRWYEMVHEMAQKAGVRVRKVAVLKVKAPNAFANAFGRIALTQGLLRQMEPGEVRVVVAHELGHLKHAHPRRTLTVLLAVLGALWLGLRQLTPYIDKHVPCTPAAMAVFTAAALGIVCVVPPLLVGPLQRRREREADAVAVELTGDPELVIRALTRLHCAAGHPGRLKPGDELLSAHPSLNHRIDAIRAAFPRVEAAGRTGAHGDGRFQDVDDGIDG
jgi:Zn-dependent protease with chaperone function